MVDAVSAEEVSADDAIDEAVSLESRQRTAFAAPADPARVEEAEPTLPVPTVHVPVPLPLPALLKPPVRS
eukprot:4045343-Prymnesium_polylepis.2